MRCVEPFVKAGEVYPCGKCLPCRFKARRIWFHRVLLEASQHDYNAVVTLTYDESSLCPSYELSPEHLRDWIKRYRKRALERYAWRHLRFFACGEYGEKSGRPHFHVVLFGQPPCEAGRSGSLWTCDCGCDTCQDISLTWSLGASSVDALTKQSASYVAGYVTRKVLASSVGKKQAPFTRMSLRPGIGANAMHDVASTVLQYNLGIPSSLGRHNGALLLGRYLRKKLSEFSHGEIPVFEPTPAMQMVRDVAWSAGINQKSLYQQINSPYESQLAQRERLKEKVL